MAITVNYGQFGNLLPCSMVMGFLQIDFWTFGPLSSDYTIISSTNLLKPGERNGQLLLSRVDR